MNNTFKNKKGFTLIELLIVIVISSIILLVGYNFFTSSWTNYSKQVDNVDNQEKAKRIVRDITGDVRKVAQDDILIKREGKRIDVNKEVYNFRPKYNDLRKNGKAYMSGIKNFNVIKEENKLIIEITTMPKKSHEITITSTIYIRE